MISERVLFACVPALVVLTACVSYPPYPSDSGSAAAESQPASSERSAEDLQIRSYNLAHVTTWSVEGDWSDGQASSGRLRQSQGEGPWKVLVLLREESQPREHVVGQGALVGEWGERALMIDDSAASE